VGRDLTTQLLEVDGVEIEDGVEDLTALDLLAEKDP